MGTSPVVIVAGAVTAAAGLVYLPVGSMILGIVFSNALWTSGSQGEGHVAFAPAESLARVSISVVRY